MTHASTSTRTHRDDPSARDSAATAPARAEAASARERRQALRSVAMFGGGSGGHLFPGIAVAERLVSRFPGCRVVFYSSGRDIERRILGASPFEARALAIRPPGRSPAGWVRFARAASRERRRIESDLVGDCDVAFGLGGYASVPGILAARRLGCPVVLLEQNRVAGRVNRLFARRVAAIAAPWNAREIACGGTVAVTGNPVRRDVLAAAECRREREAAAGEASGSRRRDRTVVVVGGSQGARALNRLVIAALEELSDVARDWRFVHIAGEADRNAVARAYAEAGIRAEVVSFAFDLPQRLAEADLVVSRAGGTTLAELAVMGVPSILVPYPHHRDRHQVRNAEAFAEAGAALAVAEGESSAFTKALTSTLARADRRAVLADRARALGRADAADAVIDLVLEL